MKRLLHPILLTLITSILINCQSNKGSNLQGAAPAKTEPAPVSLQESPFVPAQEAIAKMQVEPGFEVKLVAAEPLVSTPVTLSFDAKGRMWVVEMTGYMPDTVGTGEDVPNGKIVILEDKNKDGVADERKVFLDGLVLPRAICLIENGILVAEPPRLWYYEMKNDKPGKKTLVDEKYTEGGNVEHQPNGLLRAMDNWIYNAKASKRYRKQGDTWLIERTHFRGQWGISQDNSGRLYYNTNSENLLADYFSPGLGATNKNQKGVEGFNEKAVADNKVYPIRPTPAVNRGYLQGILDDKKKLVNFTAACGPLVYRGHTFGPAYAENVFVAEPSANLIKRNILTQTGFLTQGGQAYANREFLASTDERFRPVNMFNGPDGALYVVDMYRGIIQHKTYLTTYLKNEIKARELTSPLNAGRIYKVVPQQKRAKPVTLPTEPARLVNLLGHENGWVRDMAQQLLVDSKNTSVVPALQKAIQDTKNVNLVNHALWALEGLGALKTEEVLALLNQPVWSIRAQALSSIPSVINQQNYQQFIPAFDNIIAKNDSMAAPYVAFLAPAIQKLDKTAASNLQQKLMQQFPNNRYVADALISGLEGQETQFMDKVVAFTKSDNMAIRKQLQKVITSAEAARGNRDPKELIKMYPQGAAMFTSSCQTCHGADGNGVKSLAPPLNQSEWVTGDKDKLISIVLYGLTGPVKVNGHVYKAPEINGDMPGIGYNQSLSNEDVAQLLSFIRKSWRNKADRVTAEEVGKVREKLKTRQKAFTVEELAKL